MVDELYSRSAGIRTTVQAFVGVCAQLKTTDDLWREVKTFAGRIDVDMMTYHSLDAQTMGATKLGIVEYGLPEAFKHKYVSEEMHLVDPIVVLAAQTTVPFFWSEVPDMMPLNAAQKKYLGYLRETGFVDGIALQVFGPQARNALVMLHVPDTQSRLDREDLLNIQWGCQCAHVRFCILSAAVQTAYPKLSPRETDVLRWIARGKTNMGIARVMGISRHTVDTIMRRMFEKLGVTDRTTAVVRGIASGQIDHKGDMLM